MITADQIDVTVVRLNGLGEDQLDALIDTFWEKQPEVLGYIMSDEAAELGENEAEILLISATTLWQVAEQLAKQPLKTVAADDLDALQDANWSVFDDREQAKGESFVDFVEPIIEAYPQPELLHYITDMMTEDEDEQDDFSIEPAAKLPMFVMLKTVADALFL